jgi:hypothetical protein
MALKKATLVLLLHHPARTRPLLANAEPPGGFTIHKTNREPMKRRFLLYLRGQTYYCEDTQTRKQASLRTKDREIALRFVNAKNEVGQQPAVNLQIARAYLVASDPQIATRSWLVVMDEMTVSVISLTFSTGGLRRAQLVGNEGNHFKGLSSICLKA